MLPFAQRLLLVAVIASLPVPVRADEPPSSERIEQLIRQLGDESFARRKAATTALERIGMPALPALRKAASANKDSEVSKRAAELVVQIENGLDQLLADYRAYGLPLPPENAPLVRFRIDYGYVRSKRQPSVLGFLIEPATWISPAKVLRGFRVFCIPSANIDAEVDPLAFAVKDVETSDFDKHLTPGLLMLLRQEGACGGLQSSISLLMAIQMHFQGWSAASTLIEKGFRQAVGGSARTSLRIIAWELWQRRLCDPAINYWPSAQRHLKALLSDEPELDLPENKSLLRSLELALEPSSALQGTVEAVIDDLINVRGHYLSDDRYLRVLERGFDAVPALLEHLNDNRLTGYRSAMWMVNNLRIPAHQHRVHDLASDLLRSIAGKEASKNWPDDRTSRAVERAAIEEWWNSAKKHGEQNYLVKHVLPPLPVETEEVFDRFSQLPRKPDSEWPELAHIRLIGKKYPKQLPEIYREVLEKRPRMITWPITEAIADSRLPLKEKLDLFALGAQNKCSEHRRMAFRELQKLDSERFVAVIVEVLKKLPAAPKVPYADCEEPSIVDEVCATDDRRLWKALDETTRRVDVGLRLEFLNRLKDVEPRAADRQQRLSFLVSFLEDRTVRDVESNLRMYSGNYAAVFFPRIEVRNFAAMQIAEMLKLQNNPAPEWTEEQWADLRERMRKAAKSEITSLSESK